MKVAYLGPPGTFGEVAARSFFPDAPDADLVPVARHAEVARAVDRGGADRGVMAIENLLNGSVRETLDTLIHETDLHIQGELLLPVVHNLVAAPGMSVEEVDLVISHTQALEQCNGFLEQHCPKAKRLAALSTAEAVAQALNQPRAAAIATRRAADLYGAEVLAEAIQDSDANVTRFITIGPEVCEPSGRDRTSIAFDFDGDRPGLLTAALAEFSSRGINCSKLESRPTRATFGRYVFLIDFEGHARDPICAAAIAGLSEMTTMLKIFGSYPRAIEFE